MASVITEPQASRSRAARLIPRRVREPLSGYPRPIWALIAAIFVLWTGRGMTIPFTVIFFTQVVGLSGATVGSGIAIASLVGIAMVTVTAGQIDRRGGRPVLMTTIASMGVATILLAWAEGPLLFFAFSLMLYVSGQSYWPSVDTVTTSLADSKRVITSMSMVRVANAMGIGVGGFIGGIMVAGGGLTEYRIMYITGGVLILAASLLVRLLVPLPEPAVVDESAPVPPTGGWRDVIADRTFMYALMVLFALVLGFTQVNMSVPPFLRAEAGIGEGVIGSLFLMNTVLIILLQVPIAGRVDRGNAGILLAVAALIWAGAFAFMIGTAWSGAFAVLVFLSFTSGELIFMPISAIFAVRLSPAHLRGRYFSLLSITWGGSFAIATFAAGFVQDASRPVLLWPVMVALMLTASVAALRLRRSKRLEPPLDDDGVVEPEPAIVGQHESAIA